MDERGPAREAAPVGQPVESAGTPALHGESSVRARKSAESAAAGACLTEAASFVQGYKHDYLSE